MQVSSNAIGITPVSSESQQLNAVVSAKASLICLVALINNGNVVYIDVSKLTNITTVTAIGKVAHIGVSFLTSTTINIGKVVHAGSSELISITSITTTGFIN